MSEEDNRVVYLYGWKENHPFYGESIRQDGFTYATTLNGELEGGNRSSMLAFYRYIKLFKDEQDCKNFVLDEDHEGNKIPLPLDEDQRLRVKEALGL